jgi:hypothetical protein
MAMRGQMQALIRNRDAMGGSERLLNVDERLKADRVAVGRKP